MLPPASIEAPVISTAWPTTVMAPLAEVELCWKPTLPLAVLTRSPAAALMMPWLLTPTPRSVATMVILSANMPPRAVTSMATVGAAPVPPVGFTAMVL